MAAAGKRSCRDDPYAFMALLKNRDLISIRRNRSLAELAAAVRRRPTLANVLLEMAELPEESPSTKDRASPIDLEADFLNTCSSTSVEDCRQLLSMARSSYRLRDDDNIIFNKENLEKI